MTLPVNDLVALLQQLIRMPSPNPPGDCRAIAEFCAAFLQEAGFATTLVAPDDRAWSVVGVLGERDTPSLLYHAHIDTVPLGQNARWSVDPFAGVVADGRVYGLGSVDDKAPLAAMLQAAAAIGAQVEKLTRHASWWSAPPRRKWAAGWARNGWSTTAMSRRATSSSSANRPTTAWRPRTRASCVRPFMWPAAQPMPRIPGAGATRSTAWRASSSTWNATRPRCWNAGLIRCLGRPASTSALIDGGVGANVVADACTIRVDRRMVPGEDPQAVIGELQAIVAAAAGS